MRQSSTNYTADGYNRITGEHYTEEIPYDYQEKPAPPPKYRKRACDCAHDPCTCSRDIKRQVEHDLWEA